MDYILFFVYLIFFCFFLPRIKFIKKSGLSTAMISCLFLLKVFAGVMYGWINTYYLQGDDTFVFFNNSIKETDLLFNDPLQYFKTFFISNYDNYGNFFGSKNSFWNDLRGTLLEKLLSIFNIFSHKNYYINSLFFNLLTFFGFIALYRVFIKVYPKSSWIIIAGLLIPTALYYTSGIHKDGLIFLGITVSIFNLYRIIESKEANTANYIFLFGGLLLIFLIRNFFFMAILPAFLCWIIASRYPQKTILIFLSGYAILAVVFFTSHLLHPSLNFPAKICDKQYAFLNMTWARSYIPTDSLQPTITSFVKKFPEAVNHALARPYITENYTAFYTAAGIEVLVFLLLFVLFIFFKKPLLPIINPFIIFCLIFAFTCFLMIGYTIPIIGAIVRYRSTVLPLFFIPLLCNINWNKIKYIIYK